MLVLANMGRYCRQRITSVLNTYIIPIVSSTTQIEEMNPIMLLMIFIIYLIVGGIIVSVRGTMALGDTYLNGIFINFRAITADFSDVVPHKLVATFQDYFQNTI
jgi:hypothetical protein